MLFILIFFRCCCCCCCYACNSIILWILKICFDIIFIFPQISFFWWMIFMLWIAIWLVSSYTFWVVLFFMMILWFEILIIIFAIIIWKIKSCAFLFGETSYDWNYNLVYILLSLSLSLYATRKSKLFVQNYALHNLQYLFTFFRFTFFDCFSSRAQHKKMILLLWC